MSSLFGTNSTHRSSEKHTAYPVELTDEEIELFRALNHDEGAIRERAERLRMSHAELRNYTAEEVVALKLKLDHMKNIETYLRSGTNALKSASFFLAKKDSLIFTALNVVRTYQPDISLELMRVFEPDFHIPTDTKSAPRKVITSQRERTKVSTVLRKLSVPEGIASKVESLYQDGPNMTAASSLAISLLTRYMTGTDEEPTNTANFAFDEDA
jgi:hypothetical protein